MVIMPAVTNINTIKSAKPINGTVASRKFEVSFVDFENCPALSKGIAAA